ncbi:chemotaxis protein CheW [Ideonella sp.]|uniref:chemotaxis protein CheW n=1 Tax=Ideonella sp. TaxID=1929293 RepID=UPI003BB553FD
MAATPNRIAIDLHEAGDHQAVLTQLLRMSVGAEVLAVPIDAVHEILEVGRLTALPRTPAFVRGVMNLRGAVVPVIDLAALLGLDTASQDRRTCIVVVEVSASRAAEGGLDAADDPDDESPAAFTVGLMVKAVHEVFEVGDEAIESVPPLGTAISPDWLSGMTRARGAIVGILALDRALAPQWLSSLIAQPSEH